MRRTWSAALSTLLFVSLVIGAGCWSTSPVLLPTGAECAGQTIEDAAECEGQVCLVLNENVQGIAGLCSAPCSTDEDCTPHEKCVVIETATFCMRVCAEDDDCYDGAVCRLLSIGDPTRYCLADPI
jgi:hypothetical protein